MAGTSHTGFKGFCRNTHGQKVGETTKQVLEIRNLFPDATASEISRLLNVSRERVRQILKAYHFCTKMPPKLYKCNQCGKETRRKLFCSRECLRAYYAVTYVCSYCGKLVTQGSYNVRTRMLRSTTGLMFCNRICRGKWFGEKYGFKAHPENQRGHVSKYPVEQILRDKKSGMMLSAIAKKHNMTQGAINNIIYSKRNYKLIKEKVNAAMVGRSKNSV